MRNFLPNGDSYTHLQVHPAKWQSAAAPMTNWYIHYRYHAVGDDAGKLIIVKGMNKYKVREERQQVTLRLLKETEAGIIARARPLNKLLSEALDMAWKKVTVTKGTRAGLKHVVGRVKQSIRNQDLDIPVNTVSRKHIKQILDGCYGLSIKFSDRAYNQYRTYLSILFRYLLEIEMVENNPVHTVEPKKTIHKLRQVMSLEEWHRISSKLKEDNYSFYRFLHIFFCSGARITELLAVRKAHVNIPEQLFTVTIRKGTYKREVNKVIACDVLSLWKELMNMEGDYVFSERLVPGNHPIRYEQIKRRWEVHVREKLGVKYDCYSLKHLYTDLLSQRLGIDVAAANAGHTSSEVTTKYYATGHEKRLQDALKAFSIGV